jgi:hypothetical protein
VPFAKEIDTSLMGSIGQRAFAGFAIFSIFPECDTDRRLLVTLRRFYGIG